MIIKMNFSIISFTQNGKALSQRIADMLKTEPGGKIEATSYTKCKDCMEMDAVKSVLFVEVSVAEWANTQMQAGNAMLFIGACGIAVRAVAPFLTDKLHDVPVLVMDEKGRYVIPVLSGHMGGANALAMYLARKTGAEPVITTATDINGKFAVDLFAKKNGLSIMNQDGIARVSSRVLAGEVITMSIETGHIFSEEGVKMERAQLPEEVCIVPYPPAAPVDVLVTSKDDTFDAAILLRPREYVIGIGCKKGKGAEEISQFIAGKLDEAGLTVTQVYALSSISQKRDEQGLVEWCRKEKIPFFTYTADELQEVEGNFTKSNFVKKQVGVDNVCERAALRACGFCGKLVVGKYAEDGMTIAIARREWKVEF